MNILFICMGNICRSPAAEGVFNYQLQKARLSNKIKCDSAGTISFHTGNPADKRMQNSAKKRGILLLSRARKVVVEDFNTFDLLLTMDDENYENILHLAPDQKSRLKVKKFCNYCHRFKPIEVPDPYYGGAQGFELVLDLLEEGCQNLLQEVKSSLD